MKKVTLYIAESLDGYVATKDGSVGWLDEFNNVPNADYGYGEFIKTIDTVVQGNTTYQQFKDKHVGRNSYVFTHDPKSHSEEGVTFVDGSPREFVKNLDEATHKNIWLVGGPNLLVSFLNEKQVDEMIIFVMPILLKEGIPLFNDLEVAPKLTLKSTQTYENGVVELRYDVRKK